MTALFRRNQERYIERANRRVKEHAFVVGDLVLVSARRHARSQLHPSGKLAPKATGPYAITAEIGPSTFKLALPAGISRAYLGG